MYLRFMLRILVSRPRNAVLITAIVLGTCLRPLSGGEPAPGTRLQVHGTRFAINGRPAFLLGTSYYGALGAAEETIRQDLDDMQRRGFNWIRVWATWSAAGSDVSAVDAEGNRREPYFGKLRRLVAECDRRGMVVDVTLSRGVGAAGSTRLQSLAAHQRALHSVVVPLKPKANWYLDLANERNVGGGRHVAFADLRELRAEIRRLDPRRLVTASHAGDVSCGDLSEYLRTVEVDFVCPHRPRHAGSLHQTRQKTLQLLAWMKEIGRETPVHYQEPFRRGYSGVWDPAAEDFAADLAQALAGGAAGWCFHNGDQRDRPDGRPRRSFDLGSRRLFDQLDDVERAFLDRGLAEVMIGGRR